MSKLLVTHEQENSITNDNRFESNIQFDMGEQGGKVQFTLVCKDIPIGTQIGFSADKPGPQPLINLPQTTIAISPGFIAGIVCDVPANFSCTIKYYAIFSQQPPATASVTFQAALII